MLKVLKLFIYHIIYLFFFYYIIIIIFNIINYYLFISFKNKSNQIDRN